MVVQLSSLCKGVSAKVSKSSSRGSKWKSLVPGWCQMVFSCDEQLKKWLCHSVRSFVRLSVMKEFLKRKQDLLGVLSSPEEFQLCFKNV